MSKISVIEYVEEDFIVLCTINGIPEECTMKLPRNCRKCPKSLLKETEP